MASLLLTDSTMPMSFCRAGIGCARAMAEYLGDQVHMVADVYVELERLASGLPALDALMRDWPPNPVRELGLSLKADVASVIKARQVPGQHPSEDVGEIATVLYAAKRRDEGEIFDVLTDDRYGKKLVRDRGLTLVTTSHLVVDMVAANVLAEHAGKRVWRECVPRKAWGDFEKSLAKSVLQ